MTFLGANPILKITAQEKPVAEYAWPKCGLPNDTVSCATESTFYPVIYSLQTPLKHVLHPSDCLVRRSGAERRLKLLKAPPPPPPLCLYANLESVQLCFKFAALILFTLALFSLKKKLLTVLFYHRLKKEKGGAPQKTLSGGFIAAIYLSGGLLNLIKSLLARRGFAFSVSLCWFSLPVATECLQFPSFIFIGI